MSKPSRTLGFLLLSALVLVGLAGFPAHAVRVVAVTGSASALANGESSSGAVEGVLADTQQEAIGVREGPGEFALATLLVDLPGNGFELAAVADTARPFSGGLAATGVQLTFFIDEPTSFTVTREATASGSGFTGYSAYIRFYDADGLIWDWNSVFGGSDACNFQHPNAATLCSATELPPGRYRVEVNGLAYWPPDCGSCHGATMFASTYVRFEFAGTCSDSDLDGVCFVDDNCDGLWNPTQHDRDGNGRGDRCDRADGLLHLSLPSPRLVEWDGEGGAAAWDLYRGDLTTLRDGGSYTQVPGSHPAANRVCGTPALREIDAREPMPGAADFYLVGPAGGGIGDDGSGMPRPLDDSCL